MSHNQSRLERSDSSQYRKSGRSGASAQTRNFSGGGRKGGGTASPPASSSLASNWRLKKSNNAQGGQSRVTIASLKSDSDDASASRTLQNGAADSPVTGTVTPTNDMATQKNAQAVLKAPSSQPSAVSSDTAAPPNLDEQKRHQARHNSSRAVPTFPIPSVPKQQIPRKDGGAGEQSNTGVANQMSKPKREVQISSAPAVTQTQTPSVHPVPEVSMLMPFHQPQVPVQFGGPNTHIQSQGITATSSLPMPFPMGNAPQWQQQVFVPSMQPHPMQPQGIMHQGQNMNFTPQMGSQLPPQLGNLGVSMGSQFAQQQAGKYGSSRKLVKIIHPAAVSSDTTAPANLDEQKRHQPHLDSSRAVPTFPIPCVPKQQIPRKDGGAGEQSNTGVANQMSKPKRGVQISSAPAVTQTQTPSVHPVPGVSTPMPFHQPQVPVQFGGPYTHIQSQGITATFSLPMPIPMGNAPQWQQQVFVPSMGGKEAVVTKSVLSDEATIPVSTSSISEPALKHVGEGSEDNAGLVSQTAAGSKDKFIPELNRTKGTAARGKKKRKEILQKADAARTTSDLCMAYKGPEGEKGTVDSSQSMVRTSNINLKQVPIEAQDDIVSSEKGGHSKAEPDDWEDAADISTSKLETVGDGKKVHGELKHLGVMVKQYSRDFLLKLSEQCIDLPESFEITSHVANLMVSNVNVSREPQPSPGRSIESARRKCASKRSKVKEQKGNVHQNGPPA
ncbi:eukaryotic translation initiation factor 4G [Actinidia rufa]|uniref:Eukaryotic translation initiation factor 4G n=1 Tax=Actinidia rufa TaxID=165716 RepID=A0A7J0FPU2_9ERIC|nr:eukaryotic translation initiation factor 4G [Actinidia rufa]